MTNMINKPKKFLWDTTKKHPFFKNDEKLLAGNFTLHVLDTLSLEEIKALTYESVVYNVTIVELILAQTEKI